MCLHEILYERGGSTGISMIFFSILCALLIDHFRPSRADNLFIGLMQSVACRVRKWCDAPMAHHVRAGWVMAASCFVLPVLAVYWLCLAVHPFLGLLWNILVLYMCMGFRHYNRCFTSIQMALLNGENVQARDLLSEWCHGRIVCATDPDVPDLVIEKSLLTVLQDVFGVIFWFVMPLGPAGAVFYRIAACLYKDDENRRDGEDAFSRFAERMSYWINWIPVRLMAVSFALIGNFEATLYEWKHFSARWKNSNVGVLMASAGGAMGIRLGIAHDGGSGVYRDPVSGEMTADEAGGGTGELPTIRFLQSALGLIWRTLLLWLVMLFLLTMAL